MQSLSRYGYGNLVVHALVRPPCQQPGVALGGVADHREADDLYRHLARLAGGHGITWVDAGDIFNHAPLPPSARSRPGLPVSLFATLAPAIRRAVSTTSRQLPLPSGLARSP
jgi:hypothetical protein